MFGSRLILNEPNQMAYVITGLFLFGYNMPGKMNSKPNAALMPKPLNIYDKTTKMHSIEATRYDNCDNSEAITKNVIRNKQSEKGMENCFIFMLYLKYKHILIKLNNQIGVNSRREHKAHSRMSINNTI